MNNTIYKILTEVNLKYNLKISNNNSIYRLEDTFFWINLQFHNDTISYWINNKYGFISSFFLKKKIQEIIDDIEKESLSKNISFKKLIINNLL